MIRRALLIGILFLCSRLLPCKQLLAQGVAVPGSDQSAGVVAVATNRIHSIQTTGVLAWLDDFLYLPEVLYVMILV